MSLKIYNHIGFEEQSHKYTNLNTQEVYRSVSTIITALTPPFEGNENQTRKTREKFNMTHEEVLALWKEKNTKSIVHGKFIHHCMEFGFTRPLQEVFDEAMSLYPCTMYIEDVQHYQKLVLETIKQGKIITEQIVYNDECKMAGQADLVVETDDALYLYDYKTNQKNLFENGYSKFYPPISHLDTSKINGYSLQLNFYRLFLQQIFNKPVKGMFIFHFYRKGAVYEVPAMDVEIRNILKVINKI
jgi:ATP-dependent exoDNAse (exonuclease V) beta subunit